jgi:single-strand DNA-binding protein
MSINDTTITVVGNLTADPDLKFSTSGKAITTIRIASTPRYKDQVSGEWKDATTLFLTSTIWGTQGENVAESLLRGAEVIVRGRLKQRSYETREGERRTVVELEAEHIGPSLRNATAKVTKAQRQTASPAPDTWNTTAAAATDPWSGAPVPAGVGAGPGEPPF